MKPVIDMLECRTFFSVTAATISTDEAAVTADGAAFKGALAVLVADNAADDKAVAAAFKSLPKTDKAYSKELSIFESKARSLYTKDVGAVGKLPALVNKAVAAGGTLLTKASIKTLASESKSVATLQSSVGSSIPAVETFFEGTTLTDLRTEIAALLPSATSLVTALDNQNASYAADKTAAINTAAQLETSVLVLATDLTSLHAQAGTFPNAQGTFSGTAVEVSGKHKGTSLASTLVISSEDSNGNLVGTVTDLSGGTDPLAGTITLNGVIALKSTPGAGSVKIAGVLIGNTITGGVSFPDAKGTFTVTRATG